MSIPSQCPECHRVSVTIREVPPDEHDRGDQWCTKAKCDACDQYLQWFENV